MKNSARLTILLVDRIFYSHPSRRYLNGFTIEYRPVRGARKGFCLAVYARTWETHRYVISKKTFFLKKRRERLETSRIERISTLRRVNGYIYIFFR